MIKRYYIFVLLILQGVSVLGREVQTSIPIVKLSFEALDRDTFSAATMQFIEGEDTLSLNATIRQRGRSTAKYEKQSFALKIYDEDGEKTDVSFMGMRSDNYWILDAMAPDKARMRNRVAMDLWLDFSANPYYINDEPKLKNGTEGQFVEVYVNESYNGLYCLTERVDRKQLKLQKEKKGVVHGVLYKSDSWQGNFFVYPLPYDNKSGTWMRYSFEYPDVEDSLITWEPLYNDYYFVYASEEEEFVSDVKNRFDVPVFTDYDLFTLLLEAQDNLGKNLYLSYYDIAKASKVVITPWDIDHSWGRDYKGEETDPLQHHRMGSNGSVYQRLRDEVPGYTDEVKAHYAALREDVFSADSLKARFHAYFDLFRSTGAGLREQERWNGIDDIDLDFEGEETYIDQWIDARVPYIDALFDYHTEPEVPTGVENTQSAVSTQKIVRNGQLFILREGKLYNAQGMEL